LGKIPEKSGEISLQLFFDEKKRKSRGVFLITGLLAFFISSDGGDLAKKLLLLDSTEIISVKQT
jgi:hypothetical protein